MSTVEKNQQLFFVTGKGGVGKSLVAAALAEGFVQQGHKTLLIELGHESFYRHFYGLSGEEERFVLPNGVEVQLLEGEAALKEYVLHYVKISKIVDLFFENKVSRSLVKVAPGLKELAVMGKITSGIRKIGPPFDYDKIIVDGYATGHFLALLRAPRGMYEAIQVGPMGVQSKNIISVLSDPSKCQYYVVGLPEEMAIKEAIELRAEIYNETQQASKLIINQVLPKNIVDLAEQASPSEKDEFVQFLQHKHQSQIESLRQLVDSGTVFRTLDFYYENESLNLVKAMAGQLGDL
ncbi:MAG: ArsA family ATPase [Bdellovibrionales bacterium]|nr:ArsA family ATPase [Bdellovibrionales bacterium]